MTDDKWQKLNTALLVTLLIISSISAIANYNVEKARRERLAAAETATVQIRDAAIRERALREQERRVNQERWESLSRELGEIEERLPKR